MRSVEGKTMDCFIFTVKRWNSRTKRQWLKLSAAKEKDFVPFVRLHELAVFGVPISDKLVAKIVGSGKVWVVRDLSIKGCFNEQLLFEPKSLFKFMGEPIPVKLLRKLNKFIEQELIKRRG